jgi:hypothetical protein
METAKEMTRESLPIKCLEAVILGMYPLSFALSLCDPVLELVVSLMSLEKNVRSFLNLTWLELNTPKVWLFGSASSNQLSVVLPDRCQASDCRFSSHGRIQIQRDFGECLCDFSCINMTLS